MQKQANKQNNNKKREFGIATALDLHHFDSQTFASSIGDYFL